MTQILLWHEDDIQWLKDVHLKMMDKADSDRIQSAVLFGYHEDSPDMIHMYDKLDPSINDNPFAEYHHNEEGDVIILNGLQKGSRQGSRT